jgi:hypothetical protein
MSGSSCSEGGWTNFSLLFQTAGGAGKELQKKFEDNEKLKGVELALKELDKQMAVATK